MDRLVKNFLLTTFILVIIYWKGSESYSLDDNIPTKYGIRSLVRLIRQTQGQSYNSKTCITPAQPANGEWIVLSIGERGYANSQMAANSVIKYSCEPGYKLSVTVEDSYLVQCMSSGVWSVTVMPICQKLCPSLYNSPLITLSCKNAGSTVPCDKAIDNTLMTYKCAPYYEPPYERPKSITCYHGAWDYTPDCILVCGEKSVSATTLIVNGTEVKKGHYPWTVALYSSKGTDHIFTNICGGSLLTTQIVITAAHCVTTKETGKIYDAKYFRVGAGKYYNRYEDSRDQTTAQYAEVALIETHMEYKGEVQNFRGDIALLKLKTNFFLSNVVQPVCYNNLPTLEPNTLGLVTGWGYTLSYGEPSETLKELELPYNEAGQCLKDLDEDFTFRYFTPDKLCAGFNNQNASVCKGDSGGGLVFRHPYYKRRYFIHGIVSLSHSYEENQQRHCNIQRSALFTKVETYLEWIQLMVRQWTTNEVKKCITPAQPVHGGWVYFINGNQGAPNEDIVANTIIVFSCEQGYQLAAMNETNLKVVCEMNGEWSVTPMPLCQSQRFCPSFHNSHLIILSCKNNDLDVLCDNATDNTILTYTCAPYYEPPDGTPMSSTCYNGSWDYTPDCIPVCGEKRVFAGNEVETGHYPWAVALYFRHNVTDRNFTIICGGTLIKPEIVVTAALCVTSSETGKTNPLMHFLVGAGQYYSKYDDSRDSFPSQHAEVALIKIRREFKIQNIREDIALLKLKTELVVSKAVQPVCYNNAPSLEKHTSGVVTGWGQYTTSSGKPSETLKEFEVLYNGDDPCLINYEDFDRFAFTTDKLCTELLSENTSLCPQDNGGGLVFRNPHHKGRYFLHGIASFTESFSGNQKDGCTIQRTALFTKVEAYIGWISITVQEWSLPRIHLRQQWTTETVDKANPTLPTESSQIIFFKYK